MTKLGNRGNRGNRGILGVQGKRNGEKMKGFGKPGTDPPTASFLLYKCRRRPVGNRSSLASPLTSRLSHTADITGNGGNLAGVFERIERCWITGVLAQLELLLLGWERLACLTCLSSWWLEKLGLGFLSLGRCVRWFVPAGTVAGGVRLHGRPSSR